MKTPVTRSFAALSAFAAVAFAIVPCAAQTSLSKSTVNQWVKPSTPGVFQGRVIIPVQGGAAKAVEGAKVSILGTSGKILHSAQPTNANGEFTITGVRPGIYALSARAEHAFAASAVHILDHRIAGDTRCPSIAEISAADVDYATVKNAIVRYMPPASDQFTRSLNSVQFDALAGQVCSDVTCRVVQTAGGLRGRLHAPGAAGTLLTGVKLTNVFIFRNGYEIARTLTNANGVFEVTSLSPGVYSLLAVGPDGLGMMGFELMDEDSVAPANSSFGGASVQFVAQRTGDRAYAETLVMQVAPPTEIIEIVDPPVEVVDEEEEVLGVPIEPYFEPEIVIDPIVEGPAIGIDSLGTPVSGGTFAPTMGGAGGGGAIGGGTFGGLGSIAGLAGVGGIVAVATADDDDTAITTAPAASPAAP